MHSRLRPLPLVMFLALCLAVIVVGSLYPLRGWVGGEAWSLDFLFQPLPRYITRHDLTTNLLVYLPFGYALSLLLSTPRQRSLAILATTLVAALLSATLESLQQLLPGRIASNLDVYINALGGLVGGLLALHHGRWQRAWRASGAGGRDGSSPMASPLPASGCSCSGPSPNSPCCPGPASACWTCTCAPSTTRPTA